MVIIEFVSSAHPTMFLHKVEKVLRGYLHWNDCWLSNKSAKLSAKFCQHCK